jgi:uncharacterized protein YceK
MQLALVLAILFLSGCAGESRLTKEKQANQASRMQAYEAGQQFRQQYITAKRPVLDLKYRHQYPTMSEEEIEILVNDAVEDGLRQAGEQEMRRRFEGSLMRPPVTCTSSKVGSYTYTDC